MSSCWSALRAASVLAETPPPSSISQPQHSPSPASSSAPTSHRGSLEFSGSHACSFEGGESNTDGAARQEARKAKKAMYNSRRKRYKHYHEDASLYKVIRKAGYLLQVLFSTSLPFPSDEARDDEIKLAFEKALDTFGFADDFYNLSIEDMKMLQQEDGSIRSRVQREVNARIATVYGLDPAPSPSQVLRNKERVSALLKDSAFHYESPETQEGRFQHPIIQQVIHAVWFSHRTALGCLYQDDFNPIPHATIALVLTSIRHTLSMYQTGKLVSGDFTHSYFTVYDQYVSSLAQMDEGDMRHFWRHHRRMMFKLGLDRAGVREDKEEELVIARAPQDVMAREIERMRLKMVSSDTSWDCNVSRNTSPVSNGSAAENQGRSSPSPCPPQYSIDLAPMMLGPCSSLPGPSTLTSPSSVVSAHSAITANMPSTGSCTQATSATPSETHLGPTNNDPPT
ncbi:hypothetical protein BN946_scf184657.g43 [Trametes cinnabarina]|uniref:DUF6532 domain-containing protein n=1 Tax=Pycnoporus cinnabarinus TaxID=5643 RepID=A0A060SRI6_PYCCI|nr:hypothetical protein BN946_scf184657.g43 [Trametes cinnabarina]